MEADEELETGHGPRTPAGDNLCNDHARGMAEAYAALAEARGDRVEHDEGLGLTMADRSSPSFFANLAVAVRPLGEDGWRAATERLRRFFAAAPGGPFLVFSPWPTPSLAGAGLSLVGHPPLMLRPPGPADDSAVPGLVMREVADGAGAGQWERVAVDGFPDAALQPYQTGCLLPEAALAAPRWRRWVGHVDGHLVGAAAAWVGDHHVDVTFIATLEAARGRGVGRALTATAACTGTGLPSTLIASDLGRAVYERLGYRALLRYTLWAGERGAGR